MYNETIKREFIKKKSLEAPQTAKTLDLWFEKAAEIEKKYDTDLSQFSKEQIGEYYKHMEIGSLSTLINASSWFSQYSIWFNERMKNGDGDNNYSLLSREFLLECLDKSKGENRIFSRKELLVLLEGLQNSCDKYFMLAIFEGLGGINYREIWNLKLTDISGTTVRTVDGRELEISKKLKMWAEESADTYEYYALGENAHVYKLRGEANQIIKTRDGDLSDEFKIGRLLYKRLYRLMNYIGYTNVSGSYVKESGRIDFIKRELEDYNITLEEYLFNQEYRKPMEYIYGEIASFKSYMFEYGPYFK